MNEGLVIIPKEFIYNNNNISQQEEIHVELQRIKSYYKLDKLR